MQAKKCMKRSLEFTVKQEKIYAYASNMDTVPFPTFTQTYSARALLFTVTQGSQKLPPSLQKHRSLTETPCAGKPTSTFPACIYCLHTSLLPFDHHRPYRHRTKDSTMLLLHLWVIPKGKQAGKPGAALCVHILSPPPCPFPLSDIKGQLYSCSYSSALTGV